MEIDVKQFFNSNYFLSFYSGFQLRLYHTHLSCPYRSFKN